MPKIKRWFPVSHDINRDPEMWDLCAKYGDKALRCWLELLSIADRNEGIIQGNIDSISSAVAWAIRCKSTRTLQMIDEMMTLGWISVDDMVDSSVDRSLKVVNYAKYHRTREPEKIPDGNNLVPSEPDLTKPSGPSLINKNGRGVDNPVDKSDHAQPEEGEKTAPPAGVKKTAPREVHFEKQIRIISDRMKKSNTVKYSRMDSWLKWAHENFDQDVILSALQEFEHRNGKEEITSWWEYLRVILQHKRTEKLEHESDELKKAPIPPSIKALVDNLSEKVNLTKTRKTM